MPLGVEDGFRCEQAQGGEFGAGEENASSDERERNLAFRRVGTIEEAREAKPLDGAEDGSDVAMRPAAYDLEGVFGCDEGFALEHAAHHLDLGVGEVGEIGEGSGLHLAALAVALAEQDGGGRAPIRDPGDVHAYLYTTIIL